MAHGLFVYIGNDSDSSASHLRLPAASFPFEVGLATFLVTLVLAARKLASPLSHLAEDGLESTEQ